MVFLRFCFLLEIINMESYIIMRNVNGDYKMWGCYKNIFGMDGVSEWLEFVLVDWCYVGKVDI